MVPGALIAGLWGGLLALERRAFLQAALSRPLPAAVGVGALLGDATAGLMVGLVFELLYLGGASLGGAHADHEMSPAVAAAALAATMGDATGADSTATHWALCILLCAPLGIAGRLVETRLDARARRYFARLVDAADHGQVERAVRQNLRAMWPHFVFYGLATGLVTFLGPPLTTLLQSAPPSLLRGLAGAYPLLGTVAAATAVNASQGQGRLRVAALVALLVALLLLGALGVRTWA